MLILSSVAVQVAVVFAELGKNDLLRSDLLDKLTDAFCDFIGYHRFGAPFRETHWD